jgi:hypothetical protein
MRGNRNVKYTATSDTQFFHRLFLKYSIIYNSTQLVTLLDSISTCCKVSRFNYTRAITVDMQIKAE